MKITETQFNALPEEEKKFYVEEVATDSDGLQESTGYYLYIGEIDEPDFSGSSEDR